MKARKFRTGIVMTVTAALCASALTAGCAILPATIETLPDISTEEGQADSSSYESASADESSKEQTEEAPTESETESATVNEPETWPVDEGFNRVNQLVEPTVNVKLRKGPGTEYESAGLLVAQTRVERISDNGTWSQVIYQGSSYYVASQYLSVVEDGVTITKPAGDGPQPSQTESSEQPSSEQPSSEQPSSEQPSSEQQTESQPQPSQDNSAGTHQGAFPADGTSIYAAFAGLDNTTVPFGFGSQNRDELNRPTGVMYYKNLYGQYKADFIGPETSKTVYLTMDEGYEAGFTPKILDVLKEKNVKAVFFLTKQFVTSHPELVQRMIDEGHIIGNHTCSHPSAGMPSLGLEAEYADISWLHNYILENFNYDMKLFRYPTGAFSQQSMALLDAMGYTCVFWSFAHRDWVTTDQPDPATALQSCLASLHPGEIFLLHAVSETNTNNMAAFIDGVRAAGYEFGVYPATGFHE